MAVVALVAIAGGVVVASADGTQPPGVSDAQTFNVDETSTTVVASISPNGLDTDWQVEYGTTGEYGSVESGAMVAGSSPGASERQVTLTDLEPSTVYHFRVSAVNSLGATSSDDLAFASAGPPANIEAPMVGGTAMVGRQLWAWSGSWTDFESVSVQWQRCDDGGANCGDIAEATGDTYSPASVDLGSTLRVAVSVTNGYGEGSAYSPVSNVVTPLQVAVNTALPSIAGPYAEGTLLWADPGTWSDDMSSFSFQWQRCDSDGESCGDIGGASEQNHLAVSADIGQAMRVVVTATNEAGSESAVSTQTDVIAAVEPPVNTAPPTIEGAAVMGSELYGSPGDWTPYAYLTADQWQRCDSEGENCVDITGEMSDSYTLSGDDVDHTLRVVVTATNLSYSASANSEATSVVQHGLPENVSPPVNSGLPAISGTPEVGAKLRAGNGTWRYVPTSFAFQWVRCDSAGAYCIDLEVSSKNYTVVSDDLGSTLRVGVTASNAGGDKVATSNETVTIEEPMAAPTNGGLPSISGTATVGATLRTSNGTWTNSPTTFGRQWRRCDSAGESCADISGAAATTYTPGPTDIGGTLRTTLTATNSRGSSSASSDATAVITPPPTSCETTGDVPALAGEPTNDNFSNAAVILGESGSTIGTLVGATVQNDSLPPESDPNANPNLESIDGAAWDADPTRSVWYCWTATTTGVYDFDTKGSPPPFKGDGGWTPEALPPIVIVWSGTIWGRNGTNTESLRLVSANLGAGTSGELGDPDYETFTQTPFLAKAGQQYLIEIENYPGWTSDEGDFVLNWSRNLDSDEDGFLWEDDNCDLAYNPSQLDDFPEEGDGVGDACQSTVIVVRNQSSHELVEYETAPDSFRNLGDPTGRTCAIDADCTFDDGPDGGYTYWHAAGTDASPSSDAGECWDSEQSMNVDCDPPGAEWTVEFHHSFAAHGDNATAWWCNEVTLSGRNICYDQFTEYPWQPEHIGAETTPPNSGLENTRSNQGLETLTATDIPAADPTMATDPPAIAPDPPAAPGPQSPSGPVLEGSYSTSEWSTEAMNTDGTLNVTTSTAPGTTALTGIVQGDPEDGAIVGATVAMTYYSCLSCNGQTTTTSTDSDGAFAFIDLATSSDAGASYTLNVQADQYGEYTIVNDAYAADETYQLTVALTESAQSYDAAAREDEGLTAPLRPVDSPPFAGTQAISEVTADEEPATTTLPPGTAFSQSNVPPVITVREFEINTRRGGDDYCGERTTHSTINTYPLEFYVLHVHEAENGAFLGLNDLGATAFMAIAMNYAWLHRTRLDASGHNVDVSNSNASQCFIPSQKIAAATYRHWQDLFHEVRDERVADDAGLKETKYVSGDAPGYCIDDYHANGVNVHPHQNTASQWGIKALSLETEPATENEPDPNHCKIDDWREIVKYFYANSTDVVSGEAPGATLTRTVRLANGNIKLKFWSHDPEKTTTNSRGGTGWLYHIQYRVSGTTTWHNLVTKGWSRKDRDIGKEYEFTPTDECRNYQVWATNPVGAGRMSTFNFGYCMKDVEGED